MCMILNLFTVDNINNAIGALFPTLTVVAYCFKVINFYIHSDGMQNAFDDLLKFRFKNDNEIRVTNNELRFLYKLSVCFITTANVTIIFAFARVLFINEVPEIPLPSWYPIDWQNNNLCYWIVYIYQMISVLLTLNLNGTLDIYSIFLMSTICRQMEILSDRLVNITLECDNKSCLNVRNNSEDQTRINEELISCIKVHQNLEG